MKKILSTLLSLLFINFNLFANATKKTQILSKHEINILSENNQLVNDRLLGKSLPVFTVGDIDTPKKDMIDISSWNKNISAEQFGIMKNKYGIHSVVIKITEGTTYVNPYAKSYIQNARLAGMKINAYHYAWHKTSKGAKAEAKYFVKHAKKIGLPKSAMCVDDVEQRQILGYKATTRVMIWYKYVKSGGYKHVSTYASLNIYKSRKLKANHLGGTKKLWVAAYPYKLNASMRNYSEYSAWQFSSRMKFTETNMPSGHFDVSTLYNTYYIKNKASSKIYHFKITKRQLRFSIANYTKSTIKFYIKKKKHKKHKSYYKFYKKYRIKNNCVTIKGKSYKYLIKKLHSYNYKRGKKTYVIVKLGSKIIRKKFKVYR